MEYTPRPCLSPSPSLPLSLFPLPLSPSHFLPPSLPLSLFFPLPPSSSSLPLSPTHCRSSCPYNSPAQCVYYSLQSLTVSNTPLANIPYTLSWKLHIALCGAARNSHTCNECLIMSEINTISQMSEVVEIFNPYYVSVQNFPIDHLHIILHYTFSFSVQ